MSTMTHPTIKPGTSPDAPPPAWLTQAWLEPRFVAFSLIALIGAALLERGETAPTLAHALYALAYITGGAFGLRGAIDSLTQRRVDVDLLMILAALGAAAIGQPFEGGLLLFLFSLSNVLQDYAIGRSRQAIRALFKLYPAEAKIRRDGEIVTVPIDAVRAGDVIVIQPGDRIPADGVILFGQSAVDQAAITGESIPIERGVGDRVFAGTLNTHGTLDVQADSAGSDTVLARIIRMVEEAQDSKAPTERFLDRFEQFYALFILSGTALFIVVPPLLFGADFGANFYRAMVLMTVASPCALVIAAPASFISAIAAAARGGVLFKGGAYLEGLAAVKAIAFDKTGTLTQGQPVVTAIVPHGDTDAAALLALAAAVERRSEHPLASSIVAEADRRNLPVLDVDGFESTPGRGVTGMVGSVTVRVGSIESLRTTTPLPDALAESVDALFAGGNTAIGVLADGVWRGVIALADAVRPEAAAVVVRLRAMGIEPAMLTGDNARVAAAIAAQVGITRVYADLMPADKVSAVQALEREVGPTLMVGDGVNDAPALASASIGAAMGAAGSDVALETADLVLMGDRLALIPFAVRLSRRTRRVVWGNITFAIAVIAVLVLGTFAVSLPLPVGVLGHEGSTVIVVGVCLATLLTMRARS